MPIEGESLVIEPNYPLAGLLQSPEEEEDPDWSFRSRFWSSRYRLDVVIGEKDGKVMGFPDYPLRPIEAQLRTLGCAVAWGVEQEGRAVELLGTMLRHHPFKTYMLTGQFLETSRRSGVTYLFRKLRPTVAIAPFRNADSPVEPIRILACLCQHPIAYYKGTWAGAMCPTDDVIAALALMRGDEPMFWKRSTQHPPWRPEAGL